MKTATDSPFTRSATGRKDFMVQSGREIEWGHAFDPKRGYRVFLAFKDSFGKNTISAADTRRIADEMLDARHPEQAHLAGNLRKMAEQVEGLNRGWEAAGRPATGLDKMPGGCA